MHELFFRHLFETEHASFLYHVGERKTCMLELSSASRPEPSALPEPPTPWEGGNEPQQGDQSHEENNLPLKSQQLTVKEKSQPQSGA